MAQAAKIPHMAARKSAGNNRIPTARKRNSVHKNVMKKEKSTSEIKAERFMF